MDRMKTRYIDLIEQTFDFPQREFNFDNGLLTGTACR
jgi:hypothetical protein